ncbi:alkaline phosphatase family protein [Anaerolineales bacterium HSG6]|nr:alkaline phosphatase family protein [Anaerolineales bacterium HSG6]MDM8531814.1 alkaline phosphatase family protein [Anaerolineales bacterium HSG25]
MIRKLSAIGLSILLLANIIVLVIIWAEMTYLSLQQYRSPIRGIALERVEPAPPRTSKMVIVLLSGLGYDSSSTLDLPALDQLKQAGASLMIQSAPPTYPQSTWGTLMTGAYAELNDAPPIDKPVAMLHALQPDTLFRLARQNNLQTALLGRSAWQNLIPRSHLNYSFFIAEGDAEADEAIIEAALPIIEQDEIDLVFIQFSQIGTVATTEGLTSENYPLATERVDRYLAQISQSLDLSSSVLLVISDHGHTEAGGYGGVETEVTQQPFVIVGENIKPGTYSQAKQIDIAPTVAVILGLAPPNAAQGRILFELLRFSDEDRALAQLHIAQQRTTLATAYISLINEAYMPITSTVIGNDLALAEQIFVEEGNLNGTFELASLIQNQADAEIRTARNSRLGQEQLLRLLIVTVVILLWLMVMWRFRGPYTNVVVIATIITVLLYYGLYQIQGFSYSLSAFPNLAELPIEVTRRAAVSMLIGGGVLMLSLLFYDEGDWITLLGIGYGFSVLVTFVFAIPLFWAFWQNGMASVWFLPDPVSAFWQITGVFEVVVVATIGLLLPWPIMSLNVFISLVRQRLDESDRRANRLPTLRL